MKIIGTILLTSFVLMPWCLTQVSAQQKSTSKQVVITKHTVAPDGSEQTETIIKKGKAAENFDVESYLRENRSNNSTINIQVEDEKGAANTCVSGGSNNQNTTCVAVCATPKFRGILGVIDEEENGDKPGITVGIQENSAADKAGLQDGDIIISLNDAPMNTFEEVSNFMKSTQPGDKVRIVYERDGKRSATEATLRGQPRTVLETWKTNPDWMGSRNSRKWNWDNYDVTMREKDACLGVYTATGRANDQQGAQVTNFTDQSAAREAKMAKGDLILSIDGKPVADQEELWNEIARYKPADAVKISFMRDGKTLQVEATLKACRNKSDQTLNTQPDQTATQPNHNNEGRVITILRNDDAQTQQPASALSGKKLKLNAFRAFPNPTSGRATISFQGEAVPTTVSMFDASGRQLYREEINAFNGEYLQEFDLSEYAKGTIVVQVQQGEKVHSEQIIVN